MQRSSYGHITYNVSLFIFFSACERAEFNKSCNCLVQISSVFRSVQLSPSTSSSLSSSLLFLLLSLTTTATVTRTSVYEGTTAMTCTCVRIRVFIDVPVLFPQLYCKARAKRGWELSTVQTIVLFLLASNSNISLSLTLMGCRTLSSTLKALEFFLRVDERFPNFAPRWWSEDTLTRVNSHQLSSPFGPDLHWYPYFLLRSFLSLDIIVPREMNWSGCRACFKTSGAEMFDGPRASGSLCWGLVCVLGHATKLPSSTSPECVGNSGHGCTFPLETTSWTITATQSVLSARPCTWLCAVKTPLQTSLLRLSMSSTSSPKPAKKYALK